MLQQLGLFNEAEAEQDHKAPESTEETLTVQKHKCKPNKLFALERKFSEMSDDVRITAHQVKAEPLLEAYWLWLKTRDPVPDSKLAEAVTYALNQKSYLAAFLSHGEEDISNNFAENAIRPFAIGRKNWLSFDTVKGA